MVSRIDAREKFAANGSAFAPPRIGGIFCGMSVTRIGEFQALEGKAERLRALLTASLPAIRSSKGCRSCRLLQSQGDPGRILVIEVWDSVEAHQASVKSIPPEMVEKTRSLLAAAPKAGYYVEQAT